MMTPTHTPTTIYHKINNKECTKMAGFDLDFTIIKPKGNRRFPKDKNDWIILNEHIKPKLLELHQEKYRIVLFTNQGGIAKGNTKLSDIIYKLDAVIKYLGIPIDYIISYGYDKYRKPKKGMFELYKKLSKKRIFRKKSFYCGDAAGRKKDFNDSDKKFAKNIEVRFCIPEDICILPPI
jgi:bifunctional polynucleotide phosphatase/kinase